MSDYQRAILAGGNGALLAGHDGEVERDPQLLEEPEHAGRPGTGLVMESHGSILAG